MKKRIIISLSVSLIILVLAVFYSLVESKFSIADNFLIAALSNLLILLIAPLLLILPANFASIVFLGNSFTIIGFIYLFISSFLIVFLISLILERIRKSFPNNKKLSKGFIVSLIVIFIVILILASFYLVNIR